MGGQRNQLAWLLAYTSQFKALEEKDLCCPAHGSSS
ncbi:hypothetical protein ACHAW6_004166 [Cyclotella cf. meneghiniana]